MIKNVVKFKKESNIIRDCNDTGMPLNTLIGRNFLIISDKVEKFIVNCAEDDLLGMPETGIILLTDSYLD